MSVAQLSPEQMGMLVEVVKVVVTLAFTYIWRRLCIRFFVGFFVFDFTK